MLESVLQILLTFIKNISTMSNDIFIKTQLKDIIQEAISSTSFIGNGIETYPLYEYIMQTVFLKMTGALEQKCKLICWNIATNDYEYRYNKFNNKGLNNYSTIKEKDELYNDLIEQINKYRNDSFNIDKCQILQDSMEECKKMFQTANLQSWNTHQYKEFETIIKDYKGVIKQCFQPNTKNTDTKTIFGVNCSNCSNGEKKEDNKTKCKYPQIINLKDIYDSLYHFRNKCAHHTTSYQQNLPTLSTLKSDTYRYENYFVRFSILMFIDSLYIKLYEKYIDTIQHSLLL